MYNCLIIGAGRSGTSLVAGILNNGHYFFGKNLIPPRAANPKGFFEDNTINRLINEPILKLALPKYTVGQRWLGKVPLTAPLYTNTLIDTRIKHAITNTPFCYKDPRFCYTLPIWKRFIDKKTTKYICVFRHPKLTIQSVLSSCKTDSYLKNINMTAEKSEKIWYKMYQHVLEKHIHSGSWLFVHYNQLFTKETLDKIKVYLNTPTVQYNFPEDKLKKKVNIQYKLTKNTKEVYLKLCKYAGVHNG